MATTFNRITLVGRLGKDPESNTVGTTQFVSFSIATEESYQDKKNPGNWIKNTYWHDCSASLPSIVKEVLKAHAGDTLFVEGQAVYDERNDPQNPSAKKRYHKVKVSSVVVFPKAAQTEDFQPRQQMQPQPQGQQYIPQQGYMQAYQPSVQQVPAYQQNGGYQPYPQPMGDLPM